MEKCYCRNLPLSFLINTRKPRTKQSLTKKTKSPPKRNARRKKGKARRVVTATLLPNLHPQRQLVECLLPLPPMELAVPRRRKSLREMTRKRKPKKRKKRRSQRRKARGHQRPPQVCMIIINIYKCRIYS